MASLGSKLETKNMEWNANFTEQAHLGAALIAKPHVFEGTMKKLFSAENYYSDNPMMSMLAGKKGGEKEIGQSSWEWQLEGADCRPLVVVENVLPAGETTPGKFKRNFKIKLDENWYVPGDVISPGTSDKKFQCRVQEEVQRHGDGWIYTVRLMSDDPEAFVPTKYLKTNTQWGKLYSQYEEANEQRGSTQFSTPLAFENRMGKIGKKYKVTDYASTEVLAVAIPVDGGGYVKSWMRYADTKFWRQWYRECERHYWYARSTDTVLGANGRPVRTGPGIQEQLEDSHIHEYSVLTATLIEEYLMDIFYGRKKPGKGRKVVGYTGEYGMIQFHRAITDWAQKRGFVLNVEHFTGGTKVNGDYNPNTLEAGFQYTKYNMANGISLELVHNPLYDDRDINFEIDEVTGYPVESQRITFMDFAGEDSSSNVCIMNRKDSFAFGYYEGLYGPMGPKKSGNMSHEGSYYSMHAEKTSGIHIEDVTKCGELKLVRA